MTTFYDWWAKERSRYPSITIELTDLEDAAETAWVDGYFQAIRRHGKLGGECKDLLDHYRIPGTNKCCKCGFRFD